MASRVEPRLGLAPEQVRQRGEAMLLDRVDFFLGELGAAAALAAAERAEGAVLVMAARAAGDLRHLRRRQAPLAVAVELAEGGKSDMGDVKVQPHADRVGGDDVVDLARLEQLNLAVAGLGAERAHHHRRAAAEAAQHLGHRVDLLGRERDQRRARGQAAELGRAGVPQRREARAVLDLRARDQRADHGLERRRAEQHRLLAPAGVEQPVGEDVPALGIGGELRFVERDERAAAAVARHRLGGAQQVARAFGLDSLLAGDQRDVLVALERADLVVDLARQQPQREADRAARMAAQALDREMGLAGVGRAEHGAHAAVGFVGAHWRGMWRLRPSLATLGNGLSRNGFGAPG